MKIASPKTIVIVGGVAGGASCATRLRRMDETAEIIVIERGPYASFANCGLYPITSAVSSRKKANCWSPRSHFSKSASASTCARVTRSLPSIAHQMKWKCAIWQTTGSTASGMMRSSSPPVPRCFVRRWKESIFLEFSRSAISLTCEPSSSGSPSTPPRRR